MNVLSMVVIVLAWVENSFISIELEDSIG